MGEGRNRAIFAGLIAALAVSIGVGAAMIRRAPAAVEAPDTTSAIVPGRKIAVHIAGWVVVPGVVSVEEGSIVADVVDAAGGLRPGASSEAINLAAEVHPGEQIVVPGPTRFDDGGDVLDQGGGPISLNSADASELQALPGVGPVLAQRIVAHREEHGKFETVEDLLEVPGIGEAKLASIRDLARP